MGTAERNTVVEAFPDRGKAEFAVEELLRHGFEPEQIGYVLASGQDVQTFTPGSTKVVEGAEVGAAAGVAVGGLVGAALGTVVLPGPGTVIAGGLLAGLLGGAAAGATGGTVLGALIGLSVPEDEARLYERDFHSGHTLVTVRAAGRRVEAADILQRALQHEEPKSPSHARGRLAELASGDVSSDGSGRAFVPQP